MKEKLLTTREVSQLFDMSEKEVIDLANLNIIPHFKVAGEFLRFRKEDVLKIKNTVKKRYNIIDKKHRFQERVRDFFYFNDFYLVCSLLIIFLLWLIFKDFPF